MRKMVSMELDDEDKLDGRQPIPMPNKPDYPYGLRISLTHSELEKLGLEPDCDVGDTVHMVAMGRVTSISISEGEDNSNCRVEIQIEKLAVEDEDHETGGDDA